MSCTIDLNYLTRLAGNLSGTSAVRQSVSQGGGYSVFHIGETKERCHAEGWYPGYMGGQSAAMFEDKAKGSFWEQRMKNHKKYMELQQEAAARRRMLMKLRMNGGSVSAAELLMGLL